MFRVFTIGTLVCACVIATLTASPHLIVDTPTSVPRTFVISGTAPGSDAVHIWAFPQGSDGPPLWVGASSTTAPDTRRKFSTGGWTVLAQNLPIGTYPIVVYAHDPGEGGGFPTQVYADYTVRACEPTTEFWSYAGPSGPTAIEMEVCR